MFSLPDAIFHKIISVLVVLVGAMILNVVLRSFVRFPQLDGLRRGKTYVTILRNCISLVILIFTIHIILLILAVDITPLLASAGVIGIVVGIGARSVFEDLIAGFFLTTQSTMGIGDYIKLSADVEGTILNIGLKNLTLKSPSGALITIPNGQVKTITNLTYEKAVNAIAISLAPTIDIDAVLEVCKHVLEKLKKEEKYNVSDDSKVLGVTNIDYQTGVTITTLITTPTPMRGIIDNDFRYQVLKELEKKKLL